MAIARGGRRRQARRWGTSRIIALYLAKRLLGSIAMVFGGLVMLVLMFDVVDQLRRASGKDDVGLLDVIKLAMLHTPNIAQQLLPFAMLFAAMLSFRSLARTNELVAARAAGVSVWQFLTPVWGLAFLLGTLTVTVLNPLSAALLARYEAQMDLLDDGEADSLGVASGGLWLRQFWEGEPIVIHAQSVKSDDDVQIHDVTIYKFDQAGGYAGRIDAPEARLEGGAWRLANAIVTEPSGRTDRPTTDVVIPTQMSVERIQTGLEPPEAISFWDLPDYIGMLHQVGLPARAHVVHYQSLLATPLLFAAMLLIGVVFSLRFARRGGALVFMAAGLIAGFAFFVFANVVLAVGLSGRLPAEMAAWTPAVVAILLGLALLLYTEDG